MREQLQFLQLRYIGLIKFEKCFQKDIKKFVNKTSERFKEDF